MPGLSTPSRRRIAFVMTTALGAGLLAGCQTAPLTPHHAPSATPPTAHTGAIPDAPVLGFEPVAKGVFVSIDRRTPLAEEGLRRAKVSRSQVLAAVHAIAK